MLREELRRLRLARAARNEALAALVDSARGVDQSPLLSVLGPRHGRGCAIPHGLQQSGRRLEGLASWYGWEFAGEPTSSGAIYDPRLFTAANKELPLGSFLRVQYEGRCAIVLVNDRGPYGRGREFDLSEAAAAYLGYERSGEAFVEVDLLLPR
jgi:rare lipoprotein A